MQIVQNNIVLCKMLVIQWRTHLDDLVNVETYYAQRLWNISYN